MQYKRILFALVISFIFSSAQSQHVRVQMAFPAGIAVNAPGAAPFAGAIWIGPEWRWQRGAYVCVPGYWSKPGRRKGQWKQGYWKYTRRGYIWVPGCCR